jgi:sulfopyruvate decarboxylase subunit alpha
MAGQDLTAALVEMGVTHVVWLPDSTLGTWERAFEAATELTLVRVCREGEAWAIAAGLHLGGKRPMIVMQNTGLFESGDALRNVLFDLRLPLYALIGYRSYLLENSPDSARRYTQPIIDAWGLDHVMIEGPDALLRLADHYRSCQRTGCGGLALVPEGKG